MKLKYTIPQILLEILGAVIIVVFFVLIGIKYPTLPQQIPTHFNGAGEIDAWGNKSSIWFLLGVGMILYVLLSVVSFFPSAWNFPTSKMTEKNKIPLYQCMKTFLIATKIEMLAVFFYISIFTINGTGLSEMFIFVFFAILIGTGLLFWQVGRSIIKKYV
ncbi:MAG: DUF1648 domain-containing protein [Oscillospiraceae bacterium]